MLFAHEKTPSNLRLTQSYNITWHNDLLFSQLFFLHLLVKNWRTSMYRVITANLSQIETWPSAALFALRCEKKKKKKKQFRRSRVHMYTHAESGDRKDACNGRLASVIPFYACRFHSVCVYMCTHWLMSDDSLFAKSWVLWVIRGCNVAGLPCKF